MCIGLCALIIGIGVSFVHNTRATAIINYLNHGAADNREGMKLSHQLTRAVRFTEYSNYASAFGLLLIITSMALKKTSPDPRTNNTQQGGPGYSAQGALSPDP